MIVSDHCSTGRRLMRNYRRELRGRPPMCLECEDAVKAAAASDRQEEHHDAVSPNVGKSVALGIEGGDPAIQLGNIVVELDDGCVERIRMNDNESAEEVATKVCRKNDLPDKFAALLAEHIIDRYPTRAVDRKVEEVTVSSTETKESKTGKSLGESKTGKSLGESKTGKSLGESKTRKSLGESKTGKSLGESKTGKSLGESKTGKSLGESKTGKSLGKSKTGKSKSESQSETSSTSSDSKEKEPGK